MTERKATASKAVKAVHEVTTRVGHIASGKVFIISLYDKKGGKMIATAPFNQKVGNEFYGYSHHWDLREGKDVEQMSKRFPSIKPYKEMQKELPGLTETSYTALMAYEVYQLIAAGKMNLKADNKQGETVNLKVEWTAEPLQKPEAKTRTLAEPKSKQSKEDLLNGLSF